MGTKIFVNLPVRNLNKSVEFFTKLGFSFNPQFTDETATCMIVSEDIFVMLLTHETFRQAIAAGGTTYNEPQDYGFMYSHGFQDPDGHIWELVYMEPSAIKQTA